MSLIKCPFSDALIAKRIKSFENHPLKGLYEITEANGDVYDNFFNGKFQITQSPKHIEMKSKFSTGLSLISRTKDHINFSSALFGKKKPIPVFYVRNSVKENGLGDFFLISQLKDQELEMILARNLSWDDCKKVLKKWGENNYNKSIEEMFCQLRPVQWKKNEKGE